MQKIIHIEIVLSCGISEAFNYFTVNELLESWLPEKAEVEPKVGGKYELFWAPENREINSTIGCKVTSIEKDRFLSFEWKGPEQFQNFLNFTDPLTHVIVFFNSSRADEKKTTVNLFHTGWRNDQEWKKARDYFENGWFGALSALKEKLDNLSD